MKATSTSRLATTRRKFIEAGGHTTQSFGFGRIIGQIYALLYLTLKPMCLDDIVSELGVSKASVSISVRQLQSWSAVKLVWVKGDRKDYYEAETDFNNLIRNGLLEMIRKKLNTAGGQLAMAEESLRETMSEANGDDNGELQAVADRLQKAKEFHSRINGLLTNPLVDRLL
jgi:DNA-binding transcriptional regulator GbsR (MarR family)